MKEIILASGDKTQVSDEDYEYLNQFNWSLMGSRGCSYPTRVIQNNNIKTRIYMHYEVLNRMDIIISKNMEPDHIDKNPSNNQRNNLRVVTKSVNRHNTNLQHNNTSGIRGVNYNKNQNAYSVRISINSYRKFLGYFKTIEEAIEARRKAEKDYYEQERISSTLPYI